MYRLDLGGPAAVEQHPAGRHPLLAPRAARREAHHVPVLDQQHAVRREARGGRQPRVLREQNIEVVIISGPSGAAQYVADRVTASGNVKGILNFSPVSLALPDDVLLYSVDISVELEKLLFYLKHRGQ